MSDKTSPAGWVVEVVTLAPITGVPSYKYFNVALADSAKAIEEMRKRSDAAQANCIEAVRKLSPGEVAAIHLKNGQVKPA